MTLDRVTQGASSIEIVQFLMTRVKSRNYSTMQSKNSNGYILNIYISTRRKKIIDIDVKSFFCCPNKMLFLATNNFVKQKTIKICFVGFIKRFVGRSEILLGQQKKFDSSILIIRLAKYNNFYSSCTLRNMDIKNEYSTMGQPYYIFSYN